MQVYARAVNEHHFYVFTLDTASVFDYHYLFVDVAEDGTVEGHEVVRGIKSMLHGRSSSCRHSGVCVARDPWIFHQGIYSIGREELPENWDIAVLTDTEEATIAAGKAAANADRCNVYFYQGRGFDFYLSVDAGPWRRLVPGTFIRRQVSVGIHQLEAKIVWSGTTPRPAEDNYTRALDCRPDQPLYVYISNDGEGFWTPPKVKFEIQSEASGKQMLDSRRLILE
jgi:hypothetical protein